MQVLSSFEIASLQGGGPCSLVPVCSREGCLSACPIRAAHRSKGARARARDSIDFTATSGNAHISNGFAVTAGNCKSICFIRVFVNSVFHLRMERTLYCETADMYFPQSATCKSNPRQRIFVIPVGNQIPVKCPSKDSQDSNEKA